MSDNDIKRIFPTIFKILPNTKKKKKYISNPFIKKFLCNTLIYSDIKALEQAGVPIFAEDGKGYSLMEGYKIPPVMFTENEANALITAEQLVLKNRDTSLIKEYTEAVNKIKAVLLYSTKEKADLLSKRIAVSPAIPNSNTSNSLTLIQNALTDFRILKITYQSEHKNEKTERN